MQESVISFNKYPSPSNKHASHINLDQNYQNYQTPQKNNFRTQEIFYKSQNKEYGQDHRGSSSYATQEKGRSCPRVTELKLATKTVSNFMTSVIKTSRQKSDFLKKALQKNQNQNFQDNVNEHSDNKPRSKMHNSTTVKWLKTRYGKSAKIDYLCYPYEVQRRKELKKIFKIFDEDNSKLLDLEEFAIMLVENYVYDKFSNLTALKYVKDKLTYIDQRLLDMNYEEFKLVKETFMAKFKELYKNVTNKKSLSVDDFLNLALNERAKEMFKSQMKDIRVGREPTFHELVNQEIFSKLPRSFDEMINFLSYRAQRLTIKKHFDKHEGNYQKQFRECLNLFDLMKAPDQEKVKFRQKFGIKQDMKLAKQMLRKESVSMNSIEASRLLSNVQLKQGSQTTRNTGSVSGSRFARSNTQSQFGAQGGQSARGLRMPSSQNIGFKIPKIKKREQPMNELEMRKVVQSFEQFQDQRIFKLERNLNDQIKFAQDSARLDSEETLGKFKRPFFQKRIQFGGPNGDKIIKNDVIKTFRPLNDSAMYTARTRLMQRNNQVKQQMLNDQQGPQFANSQRIQPITPFSSHRPMASFNQR